MMMESLKGYEIGCTDDSRIIELLCCIRIDDYFENCWFYYDLITVIVRFYFYRFYFSYFYILFLIFGFLV